MIRMDKEWLKFSRVSKEYREGAKNFVEAANKHSINSGFIPCPCIKCLNGRYHDIKIVYEHLVINGMDPQYTTWFMHGEPLKTSTSVNQRLFSEFADTSKHYSELSKKNHTPCTSSRKGMTRLREDLAQMKSLHQETQHSIGDDAVSQVIGKEHRGRVRGMGHGVTSSIVQASVVGRQSFAQYQQYVDGEMVTMKQTIANLTNLLITHLPNIDQAQVLACMPSTQPTQYSSGLNPMRFSKSVQFANPLTKSLSGGSSNQVGGSNNNQCKLLDWMGRGIVVAEAEVDSKDPYTKVHHLELGPDFWRVSVKKVMISVSLPRPTNEKLTLKDTLNSFIAWPIKYIVS